MSETCIELRLQARTPENVVFRSMTIQTHSFTLLDPGTRLWLIFRSLPYHSTSVLGQSESKSAETRQDERPIIAGSDAGLATTILRDALALTDTHNACHSICRVQVKPVNDAQELLIETCWPITFLEYNL